MTPAAAKYNLKRVKSAQQGAALIELALVTPLLLLIISGIVTMGDLLCQQPWAAQSAYQLVDVLAGSSEALGPDLMHNRRDQIRDIRVDRFARLALIMDPSELFTDTDGNPTFYNEIDVDDPMSSPPSQMSLPIVGVRFTAQIRTAWNLSIPIPVAFDIVGPHLVQSKGLGNLSGFESPMQQFDCSGRVCGSTGSDCSGNVPNSCAPNSTLVGLVP